MIRREMLHRPEYVYPVDDWRLVEKRFYPRLLAQAETFFSTSNGYLGIRGAFEEGEPAHFNGTFINGFYESWPIPYVEEAFGFAKTGQTIVNVPDGKLIKLYVDDEPFSIATANLLEFERSLDMRRGLLDRRVLWQTPFDKMISIRSRRLVSFEHRHLAAMSYEVTVINADAPVVVTSELVKRDDPGRRDSDPRKASPFERPVLEFVSNYADGGRVMLAYTTPGSDLRLACGMDHRVETHCAHSHETSCTEEGGKVVFSMDAKAGTPIQIIKYLTYHTSRRAAPQELTERAERTLDRATSHRFGDLCESQAQFVQTFWESADIEIKGDPAVQQALRFNLYHVLQGTARAEGTGVPAKGLTGRGYEGHYFWDTEIYLLPFLIYTRPRVARNLLKFRHDMLDAARRRARQVNQAGALFPWRTINGEEASAHYAASTAQYHINADIVYAMRKYVDASGDREFLEDAGAEMLVETARLWLDLGFFSARQNGKFCICGVTGPDEYNTVVNNNTYTNLMARENLWFAAATVAHLKEKRPQRFAALVDRTDVTMAEIEAWQHAADEMYVAYDEELGIHVQDDEFLDKRPWDFENTPRDRYPILLNYHPLVIYRHQVIKQADVVLALFLLGDEFSFEQKRRNFDFYEPLTTGDSSLSACIQSIVAFELGYLEMAHEHARYAVLMDLADVGQNASSGVHMAAMGGTWMTIVYGMAGFRDFDGRFSFRPLLPQPIESIRFPLTLRGNVVEVALTQQHATYSLRKGDAVTLWHDAEEIRLTKDEPEAVRPCVPPDHESEQPRDSRSDS